MLFVAAYGDLLPDHDSFSAGMAKATATSAQERGLVSEAQAQTWLDDLECLEREGAYFFCVNRFLFSAMKL